MVLGKVDALLADQKVPISVFSYRRISPFYECIKKCGRETFSSMGSLSSFDAMVIFTHTSPAVVTASSTPIAQSRPFCPARNLDHEPRFGGGATWLVRLRSLQVQPLRQIRGQDTP